MWCCRSRPGATTRRCWPLTDPDVVVDADGVHDPSSRQRPPAARRPRAAAVDLGQHRFTEAGAAVAQQSDRQRHRHRRISRHPANRQGGNHIADVVLLRPVGDSQPSAAWRGYHPHRSLGGRRRILGPVPPPAAAPHSPVCPTPSNCSTASASTPWTSPACATSPRPAAGCRPNVCADSPHSAQRKGWQLFVMYGATEATARMAYLPPELALLPTLPRSGGRSPADRSPLSRWTDGPTTRVNSSTAGPT